MNDLNLPLILAAAFLSSASPGPATLAIAGASMRHGRPVGLATALGVVTGSVTWSVAAAMGLAALMHAHVWLVEAMRYLAAAYLLYLAVRAARSALAAETAMVPATSEPRLAAAYARGLALHLTNPKAILFFASLYTLGVGPQAGPGALFVVIAAVGLQSLIIFGGYALVFAHGGVVSAYARLRRGFEAAFALGFATAAVGALMRRS
jgi:threonine/homoserine/homoserine lactone efflux protein